MSKSHKLIISIVYALVMVMASIFAFICITNEKEVVGAGIISAVIINSFLFYKTMKGEDVFKPKNTKTNHLFKSDAKTDLFTTDDIVFVTVFEDVMEVLQYDNSTFDIYIKDLTLQKIDGLVFEFLTKDNVLRFAVELPTKLKASSFERILSQLSVKLR